MLPMLRLFPLSGWSKGSCYLGHLELRLQVSLTVELEHLACYLKLETMEGEQPLVLEKTWILVRAMMMPEMMEEKLLSFQGKREILGRVMMLSGMMEEKRLFFQGMREIFGYRMYPVTKVGRQSFSEKMENPA